MPITKHISTRPIVRLVGDVSHADFRDAIEQLRSAGEIVADSHVAPELIVVAQSRPASIDAKEVEELRRAAPLAGIVALVGSWCEGETRTGKPWLGVERLYWYEFSPWWRRQLAKRAAGLCPDWARPGDARYGNSISEMPIADERNHGLIVVRVGDRETANVLADVLHRAGYATAWQRNCRPFSPIRGAAAGIWDGGQLSDAEADDLSAFGRRMAADRAPVVALLDFPRRDRVDQALELGASAVLGKPWLNADLRATLQSVVDQRRLLRAA